MPGTLLENPIRATMLRIWSAVLIFVAVQEEILSSFLLVGCLVQYLYLIDNRSI